MTREQKINTLLERADDDVRRPALDVIDADARGTNTFGSKAHRAARDKVEAQHSDARKTLETLTETQLDTAIGSAQ